MLELVRNLFYILPIISIIVLIISIIIIVLKDINKKKKILNIICILNSLLLINCFNYSLEPILITKTKYLLFLYITFLLLFVVLIVQTILIIKKEKPKLLAVIYSYLSVVFYYLVPTILYDYEYIIWEGFEESEIKFSSIFSLVTDNLIENLSILIIGLVVVSIINIIVFLVNKNNTPKLESEN